MLRAYVDESGSEDDHGIFVMGGYVGFVNQWEDIAETWSKVLQQNPPVPFFRTSSFRDPKWRESHGFDYSAAKQKDSELADLLTFPPLLFSVCCSVNKDEYRETIKATGLLRRAGKLGRLWIKTPYNYCFHRIITMTLWKVITKLGIKGDVVDFVFDRNDPHFDTSNAMLRALRQQGFTNAPDWVDSLGDAIPGNDETLVPLQMADMLAGRLKDHCARENDRDLRKSLLAISGMGDTNITFQCNQKTHRGAGRRLG